MANDIWGAMGGAVGAAGKAVAKAGHEVVDEWKDDFDDVAKGFDKSIAAGVLETLDAFSTGNMVQNTWTAVGIIPDDDGSEALLKGVLNGVALNPIAFKNFLDAGQAMEPPRDAACRKGFSCDGVDVRDVLKNGACFGSPGRVATKGGQTAQTNGCGVVGKRAGEVTINDILDDKSLCFEDMLALVMIHVVSRQQKEIEAKLAEISAMNEQLDALEKEGATTDCPTAPETSAERKTRMDKARADAKAGAKAESVAKANATIDGGTCLDPAMLKDMVGMLRPLLPVLVPAISAALACAPPVGPILAVAAPVLVPMLLDLVESGALDGVMGGAQASSSSSASKKSGATGGGASSDEAPTKESLERSRSLEFEKLKVLVNRMSEMQQTLSNVLNTQHETAMAAIRNIRA